MTKDLKWIRAPIEFFTRELTIYLEREGHEKIVDAILNLEKATEEAPETAKDKMLFLLQTNTLTQHTAKLANNFLEKATGIEGLICPDNIEEAIDKSLGEVGIAFINDQNLGSCYLATKDMLEKIDADTSITYAQAKKPFKETNYNNTPLRINEPPTPNV